MLRKINKTILFISFITLSFLTLPMQDSQARDLHLLAGAGLRQPVDELIDLFQEQTGHKVLVDYGGSGNLFASIIASGQGDLYMPGAFHYIEMLEQESMVDSYCKVVAHTPVIGVNRNKSNMIKSFEDLAGKGVRIALGDPKAMAFGRIARDILEKSDIKEEIEKNVVVYGATVKQLALYVAQGDVDASIIGRADAVQYKESIGMVPIPAEYFQADTIAIALLRKAADRPEAVEFRDFMGSKRAIETFRHFGFLPLSGDEQ